MTVTRFDEHAFVGMEVDPAQEIGSCHRIHCRGFANGHDRLGSEYGYRGVPWKKEVWREVSQGEYSGKRAPPPPSAKECLARSPGDETGRTG